VFMGGGHNKHGTGSRCTLPKQCRPPSPRRRWRCDRSSYKRSSFSRIRDSQTQSLTRLQRDSAKGLRREIGRGRRPRVGDGKRTTLLSLKSLCGGGVPSSHPSLALSWSTWSAVINLTSRAGELRSAPSGPDDRYRVAGKRALALGVARSQGHNTGLLRGLVPRSGFPPAAEFFPRAVGPPSSRTPPLLGASNTRILSEGWSALWVSPSCGAPPLLGASDTRIRTAPMQLTRR